MKFGKFFILLVALMLCCFEFGCANTHNVLDMNGKGKLYKRTDTASTSFIDNDGNQTAVYHGQAPTSAKMDTEGNWLNMPGPTGMLSLPLTNGPAFMVSPKDMVISGVKYTPNPAVGQPMFEADSISANISTPLQQHTAALKADLEQQKSMTQAEAEAMVKKWEAAGEIAPEVAEVFKMLISAIFPPAAVTP